MIDLDELERLEREAPRLQPGEWQPQDFLTTPQRGRFLAAICNALPDLLAELRTLRARVAELEDHQAERDRILGARVREIACQHDVRMHDASLDLYGFARFARDVVRAMEEVDDA